MCWVPTDEDPGEHLGKIELQSYFLDIEQRPQPNQNSSLRYLYFFLFNGRHLSNLPNVSKNTVQIIHMKPISSILTPFCPFALSFFYLLHN